MTPVRIRLSTETRKQLELTLRQAFRAGDLPLVKRVTALLGIARGERVEAVARGVGVSPSSVYACHAFLLAGGRACGCAGAGGGRRS